MNVTAVSSAAPAAPAVPAKLRAKAEDFEAMVLGEMLGPMFEGIAPDSPFGGGPGEAAFRGFLIQAYGTAIAKRGGIGLADSLVQSLLATQELKETP